MVLNIIFSFNRAMQLDYLLKSILENYKIDYKILVLYHTTGKHQEGYEILKKKYKKYDNFSFVERRPVLFDAVGFSAIKNKNDLKFFVKHSRLFSEKSDNFKSLLEKKMSETDCEFVMFNTDDGYYLDKITVSSEIFNIIKHNPTAASYRLYIGQNHDNFPEYVKKWGNNILLWDYYTDTKIHHWSYPFAVDGTIYATKALLKILKKVVYHNPVTLEGKTVEYVMKNRLFGIGMSPIEMKLIGTKVNRVSVDSQNPTIHVDTDLLNEKFIDGYHLELDLPQNITNGNIVPDNVFVVKNDIRESLYVLDDFGKKVQDNLGSEGAKVQME